MSRCLAQACALVPWLMVGCSAAHERAAPGDAHETPDEGGGEDRQVVFVAVGAEGTIVTSSDGDVWHERESGVRTELSSVATNGEVFVAVGDGVVLRSADGVSWTQELRLDRAVYQPPRVVVDEGGKFFVAAGEQGVVSSDDGVTWTQSGAMPGYAIEAVAVLHVDDDSQARRVMATASYGPEGSLHAGFISPVSESSAGGAWAGGATPRFRDSVAGSRVIVAGFDGIFTSDDALTWTQAGSLPIADIEHTIWQRGAGLIESFVVVTLGSGDVHTASSVHGPWTRADLPARIPPLQAIAQDNVGTLAAVGLGGVVVVSKDGPSVFALVDSATKNHLFGVAARPHW
jgi:hypothetical protein